MCGCVGGEYGSGGGCLCVGVWGGVGEYGSGGRCLGVCLCFSVGDFSFFTDTELNCSWIVHSCPSQVYLIGLSSLYSLHLAIVICVYVSVEKHVFLSRVAHPCDWTLHSCDSSYPSEYKL